MKLMESMHSQKLCLEWKEAETEEICDGLL